MGGNENNGVVELWVGPRQTPHPRPTHPHPNNSNNSANTGNKTDCGENVDFYLPKIQPPPAHPLIRSQEEFDKTVATGALQVDRVSVSVLYTGSLEAQSGREAYYVG